MQHRWLKPYEFWNPRLFEAPFYVYLAWQCLRKGIAVRDLAKANFSLDHGEIGIGSKFHTQQQFSQALFLPTVLLSSDSSALQRLHNITAFAEQFAYPIILKPDLGMVGKGILKISSYAEAQLRVADIQGAYLLQQYCPLPEEYGVFYVRQQGRPRITGINRKHFPFVIGNGRDSLLTLAQNHYRYTEHWTSFLQYLETSQIPSNNEKVQLSFIGSHTMGCMFTDDSQLLTTNLEQAIFGVCEPQQGFNFGRLDVRAASEAALLRGEFKIIEINGVSSLPTHMFDPSKSVWQAYKIFFEHGRYLASIAREYRNVPMHLLPLRQVLLKVRESQAELDRIHNQLRQG